MSSTQKRLERAIKKAENQIEGLKVVNPNGDRVIPEYRKEEAVRLQEKIQRWEGQLDAIVEDND